MSDGTLSQDEIDALLQGTDELMTESMGNTPASGFSGGKGVSSESLSESDKANLGELLREIGQAQATALSTLTGVSCTFSAPYIESGLLDSLKKDIKGKVIQAKVNLSGGINGELVYVVPEKGVLTITNILIGQEDNSEVTDLVKNTFGEVVTQIGGSLVSVLSDKLGKNINSGSPGIEAMNDVSALTIAGGQYVARLNYVFNIQDKGSAKFFAFLPLSLARNIAGGYTMVRQSAASQYGSGAPVQTSGVPIKSVGFEPLQMGVASESMGNIALLLDVPMRVTVELGRTKMTIKEILGLGEGSIIELDKLAGEPVDILVNDKLIAQGEVVVIDENFAVRVTKIVSPMERIFENQGEGKF
jgi:flagellar motor switch protein FliN